MSLKTQVARLERAGSDRSEWLTKLRTAVDDLAKWLSRSLPDQITKLPRGYHFKYWPSGQYQLIKYVDGCLVVDLEEETKARGHLLAFADDIEDGWLNEVAEYLEKEGARLKAVTSSIEKMLDDRKA